ncbi:MAG: hypothetical protein HQL27_01920 [Candidatus Omnitrophica bacterium]|nr:hypothetical protein [Candidatus Omnitrophota bacterium]
MDFIINISFPFLSMLSLILGGLVYSRPLAVIRFQQRFYELINWRIEPVSMEKEIRNTKIMGMTLIIFVILAVLYLCFSK